MPISKHIATVLTAAVFLTIAAGCNSSRAKPQATPEAANTDPAIVTVEPVLAKQLTIGEAELRDLAVAMQVPARVEVDATRVARIGSPVAGRITRLLVLEGQSVRSGETLATLHSTDLSDTQFSFIKAFSQQKLAETAAARAEQLVKADVFGRAELERRQAELLQASTEASAFLTQLRGLGMTDASIRELETNRKLNAEYFIISSISGTVLERNVTPGQIVQPAEKAFLVADLSSVWLVADVPEQDANKIYKGMRVALTIPSLPRQQIEGRLDYVAPIVDPGTRTVQVRMNLPNSRGIFKPAMLASMMFLDRTEQKVVAPATAIVRQDDKDYVFVQIAENKFILREVSLGSDSGENRVIESGLGTDEKIVLSGAFHLNNQRKQNEIKRGE
jgi:cobalt-zinc-cadmium efflux system membrane fusion protein